MIGKKRNLLYIVPLLIFAASPLWKPMAADFLAPRGSFETASGELFIKNRKNFLMDRVHITMTSNGRPEWEIRAERAFTGQTDREIAMVDVDAVYSGKNEEVTTITSRKGEYFIDARHLILQEDVVIRKPASSQELYTDLLHYYDATKIAVSPGPVDLRGKGFSLRAGRMDYDLSTDGYDFNDRVRVDL